MKKESTLAERLSAHLEKEYEVLLEGDVAQIEVMAEAKLELLEKVANAPVVQLKSFEHLRHRLIRNQVLTQSALEGMRAAIERAKEVQTVSSYLRTYSAKGESNDVQMTGGRQLSKKS